MITLFLLLIVSLVYFLFIKEARDPQVFSLYRSGFLKAVFPFVIIIHHISFKTQDMPLMDFRYTGPYVVGIFFWMSGYGLEYKFQHSKPVWKDVSKRYRSLLQPVVLPLLVYCCLVLPFQDDWLQHVTTTVKDINLYLPYTWFVVVLALLYGFFFVFRYFIDHHIWFISAMFAALTVILLAMYECGISGTCFVSNYAFLIGIVMRWMECKHMLTGGVKSCWTWQF